MTHTDSAPQPDSAAADGENPVAEPEPGGDTAEHSPLATSPIAQAGLDLFGKGHGKKLKNLMTGRGTDEGLYIFDYYYKTGGGKHTKHWRQTVVGFDLGQRRVPRFSIQPRSLGKVFGAFFSGKEIKFDQHPEFAKDHFVAGEHDAAVRDLIREPIVREFGPEKVLCLEGNDRWLIVYRQAKLAKPEEFDELIGRARGFRAHFLNS